MPRRYSNIIAFDDAPFEREHVGKVKIVGTVYADLRLDGILIGEIEKDGDDMTDQLYEMISRSKFLEHAQLIMLQGVTFGGFNVVDVLDLHQRLQLPILVVSRKDADMTAMREALLSKISGGKKKWQMIEELGPLEPSGKVFVQRAGLTPDEAGAVVEHFTIHSHIPEPIRTAHLIAGALATGESKGSP